MTLSARSIALQGVAAGAAAIAIAVQGFVPLGAPQPDAGAAFVAGGGAAHISQSEWLRRMGRAQPAGTPVGAGPPAAGATTHRLALHKRRQAEEELLILGLIDLIDA